MSVPTQSSPSAGISIRASCHCKHFTFNPTDPLPLSSLPLKSSVCQCNSCRHALGHLIPTWAVIPPPIPRPDVSHLTAYVSSDTLTRFFCPRCGATVANFEAEEWDLAPGLLETPFAGVSNDPEGNTDHKDGTILLNRVGMWLEDSKDGGGILWLDPNLSKHIQGRTSQKLTFAEVQAMSDASRKRLKFNTDNEADPSTEPSAPAPAEDQKSDDDDLLHASCHCGAIQFDISRPPPPPKNSSDSSKYPAGLDACTSCRLCTGAELSSWAFVPASHIHQSPAPTATKEDEGKGNEKEEPFNILTNPLTLAPGLKTYSSSPGVTRGFCAVCGANIYYYRAGETVSVEDGQKSPRVDIAAGILRSVKGGARAEDWLSWDAYLGSIAQLGQGEKKKNEKEKGKEEGNDGDGAVAHLRDAVDRQFVRRLVEGIDRDFGRGK